MYIALYDVSTAHGMHGMCTYSSNQNIPPEHYLAACMYGVCTHSFMIAAFMNLMMMTACHGPHKKQTQNGSPAYPLDNIKGLLNPFSQLGRCASTKPETHILCDASIQPDVTVAYSRTVIATPGSYDDSNEFELVF